MSCTLLSTQPNKQQGCQCTCLLTCPAVSPPLLEEGFDYWHAVWIFLRVPEITFILPSCSASCSLFSAATFFLCVCLWVKIPSSDFHSYFQGVIRCSRDWKYSLFVFSICRHYWCGQISFEWQNLSAGSVEKATQGLHIKIGCFSGISPNN